MTIVLFGYNSADTMETIRYAKDMDEADVLAHFLMNGMNGCAKVEAYTVKSNTIEQDAAQQFRNIYDGAFPEYRAIVRKLVGKRKASKVYRA